MLPNRTIPADITAVASDRGSALPPMIEASAGSGRLEAIVRRVQARDFIAVELSPRFRAKERRHQQRAARAAMLVVVGAAAFDVLVFAMLHDSESPLLVGLNLAFAVLAVGGFVALGGVARRHPDAIVGAMSLLVAWTSVWLGIYGSGLTLLAFGYLLILPAVVALVVPSRPVVHAIWLLAYAVAAFGLVVASPVEALTRQERVEISVILVTAIAVSFVGSVLRFRARASAYMQLVAVTALRHEDERHRAALAQAQSELERAVRLDQLTQTGNRRRLNEDLLRARAHLLRSGGSFGLLELDIDRFKQVNDRFGHQIGDVVLRDLAAIFKRVSRDTDVVYRFGGEEFVVILAGADAAGIAAAAERLRTAVENAAIEHPDNLPSGVVTVSVGGTVIRPSDLGLRDEAWLDRADRAMYRAKAAGRNRVVMDTIEAIEA